MQTIAIISQKGGSGKTTITLNLAIAAAKRGRRVVVVDLDPQQSAARWSRLRSNENPVIVSGHGPNLATLLERAKDGGADLAFIDTAPKSENAALIAARLSNLVIIPCQPSNLDLDAIADTVNIANLAKRPTLFVLNNCRASSALPDQAAEALTEYKTPIADVRLGSLVAFVKSLTEGKGVVESEPSGAAAREVTRLHAIIVQHLNKKAS